MFNNLWLDVYKATEFVYAMTINFSALFIYSDKQDKNFIPYIHSENVYLYIYAYCAL